MKSTQRELVVVWNDNKDINKIIPLKDLTNEVCNKLTKEFGFSPIGRTIVLSAAEWQHFAALHI